MADAENIVVHFHVVAKKVQISPHVVKEASNLILDAKDYILM